MATLALVISRKKGNNSSVKITLSLLALLFCAVSCTPVHQFQAGGGAFDDTHMGQTLDNNTSLPEDSIDGARSFEEWRERE